MFRAFLFTVLAAIFAIVCHPAIADDDVSKKDLKKLEAKIKADLKKDLDARDAALRAEFRKYTDDKIGESEARTKKVTDAFTQELGKTNTLLGTVVTQTNLNTTAIGDLQAQQKADRKDIDILLKSSARQEKEIGSMKDEIIAMKESTAKAEKSAEAARIAAEKSGADSAAAKAASEQAAKDSATALAAMLKVAASMEAHFVKAKEGGHVININFTPTSTYRPEVRFVDRPVYIYSIPEARYYGYVDGIGLWGYNPTGWGNAPAYSYYNNQIVYAPTTTYYAPTSYVAPSYYAPTYVNPTYYAPTYWRNPYWGNWRWHRHHH